MNGSKNVHLGGRGLGRDGRRAPAFGADKVTFGTNWLAEAEHGGYYQAVVDGTYAKYGLDVTIVPGGPQANNRLLLATGKLDFYMGGNFIQAFEAVEQNVPTIVVAAISRRTRRFSCRIPASGSTNGPTCRRRPPSSARKGSPRSITG